VDDSYCRLVTQRRMCPDVANCIRLLYPDLEDADNVKKHPPLDGFAHNLLFMDHHHPENNSTLATSYSNRFEAKMVSKLVRHAIRNGYGQRIAIITPYSGIIQIHSFPSTDLIFPRSAFSHQQVFITI